MSDHTLQDRTELNPGLYNNQGATALNPNLMDGNSPTALNPNLVGGNSPTALNQNLVGGNSPTALNPNLMDGNSPTALNPNLMDGNSPTALNPNPGQDQPFIEQSILQPGEMVNQYQIIRLLSKSGEAEVYQCEKDDKKYAIKIYLKKISLKKEIQDLLVGKNLSPYLANMCEVDEFRIKTESGSTLRYTYEVEPFYKTINSVLPYEELSQLINDINEGMHVLHTLKETIIHKDIKPANIMMDDVGNYLLIDFGISSIMEVGMTSLKTSTGLTFDYAAPESRISNRFSPATDYYSLGITLYQLFTGEFPYANSNDRLDLLIRRGVIVPEALGMPEALVMLIQGLTFYNSNPDVNRKRWGYEEVLRWLNADDTLEAPMFQSIGQEAGDYTGEDRMPPYIFQNVTYTNHLQFVMALGEHWEEGKKALFHGILTDHYKKMGNQTLIQYCMDAEDDQGTGNDDLVYYRFLYLVEPRLENIYWKGSTFTEAEFGRAMILEPLWSCNGTYQSSTMSQNLAKIREVQENSLLSIFYGRQNISNPDFTLALRFESRKSDNIRDTIYLYYSMAYQMMKMNLFRLQNNVFSSYNDFTEFIKKSLDQSFENYVTLCNSMYQQEVQIDFYCWMKSLGMEDRVSL